MRKSSSASMASRLNSLQENRFAYRPVFAYLARLSVDDALHGRCNRIGPALSEDAVGGRRGHERGAAGCTGQGDIRQVTLRTSRFHALPAQ